MLRLSLTSEEYIQLGDDVKIFFLGRSGRHARVMIDAPKDLNVIRSSLIDKEPANYKESTAKALAE